MQGWLGYRTAPSILSLLLYYSTVFKISSYSSLACFEDVASVSPGLAEIREYLYLSDVFLDDSYTPFILFIYVVSPPSLSSFSSTISIRASLDRVTDNSSLTYPTFRLTVVFEFALLMFSDDAALTNASYKTSVNKLSAYHRYLTCVNFPSSRVMLRNTTLIRLF
jgi:hypothetical protein